MIFLKLPLDTRELSRYEPVHENRTIIFRSARIGRSCFGLWRRKSSGYEDTGHDNASAVCRIGFIGRNNASASRRRKENACTGRRRHEAERRSEADAVGEDHGAKE